MYQNGSELSESAVQQFNISTTHDQTDKLETKIIFAIIMFTLCFVTTIGNICVIYRYRKASMVGNLFIISLACADLIVGCFVMPMAGIYAIKKTWTMSLAVCQVWLAADYIASTASILNLLTLSLDRFWSITSPLKYLGKRTKSRALFMISTAWILSLLWIIPITGWSYFFNGGVRYVPEYTCETEYNQNIFFKVSTAIFNFYIPLIAMICINIKVFLVIRKRYQSPIMKYTSSPSNNMFMKNNNVQMASMANIASQHSKRSVSLYHQSKPKATSSKKKTVSLYNDKKMISLKLNSKSGINCDCKEKANYCVDTKAAPVEPPTTVSLKNNSLTGNTCPSQEEGIELQLHHHPSTTSVENCRHMSSTSLGHERSKVLISSVKRGFMNRQEKAFKQLSAIVIGFTLCFLPYFIIFLIVALCENCVSPQVYTFVVWLGYFNSTINPFLYALSNKSSNSMVKSNTFKSSDICLNRNNVFYTSTKSSNFNRSTHRKSQL